MEVQIAQLESDVAHLYTIVADLKMELRSLRDRIDRRDERLNSVRARLDAEIAAFESRARR
jgi:predicted  nucleic acid-binding Zn-ribbon protein